MLVSLHINKSLLSHVFACFVNLMSAAEVEIASALALIRRIIINHLIVYSCNYTLRDEDKDSKSKLNLFK